MLENIFKYNLIKISHILTEICGIKSYMAPRRGAELILPISLALGHIIIKKFY